MSDKEQKLIDNLNIVQECQESKNIDSCIKCELFFSCKTRKDYTLSVYQSMNEDINIGGFNF